MTNKEAIKEINHAIRDSLNQWADIALEAEVLIPHHEAFKRGHDAADDLILKFNNRSTLKSNQPIKRRKHENV